MPDYPYTLSDFKRGQRVAIAPHTDLWMMGNRYGDVVKVGRKWVHIQMNTDIIYKLHPSWIGEIIS